MALNLKFGGPTRNFYDEHIMSKKIHFRIKTWKNYTYNLNCAQASRKYSWIGYNVIPRSTLREDDVLTCGTIFHH